MTRILVWSRNAVAVVGFRALMPEFAFTADTCDADLVIADTADGITLPELTAGRVVLWTDGSAPEFLRRAIESGVAGVLLKDAAEKTIVECLTRLAAGHFWIDDRLSQSLLKTRVVKFTRRESQLLSHLTEGLRNKEIAARMAITEGTVKAYLTQLFRKTSLHDRFELALFAMRNFTGNYVPPSAESAAGFPVSPRRFHSETAAAR